MFNSSLLLITTAFYIYKPVVLIVSLNLLRWMLLSIQLRLRDSFELHICLPIFVNAGTRSAAAVIYPNSSLLGLLGSERYLE